MKFFRRVRLAVITASLCAPWISPIAAQQPPPPGQQQPPPAQPPAPQQKKNPFETIPTEQPKPAEAQPPPGTPPPQRPQWEAPTQPATAAPAGQVIEGFEFRGAKRVP